MRIQAYFRGTYFILQPKNVCCEVVPYDGGFVITLVSRPLICHGRDKGSVGDEAVSVLECVVRDI